MDVVVIRVLILIAALGALMLVSPAAQAAKRTDIIRDCEDDSKLEGSYTAKELRDARSNLPSDKDAYSDCRDVLGAAIAASARAQSGASSGGATTSPSAGNVLEGGTGTGGAANVGQPAAESSPAPAPPLHLAPGAAPISVTEPEARALRKARAEAPAVDLRGTRTVAGVRGVAGQAATTPVPTSLAVVLALLAVTLLVAAVPYVRRRVIRRRAA